MTEETDTISRWITVLLIFCCAAGLMAVFMQQIDSDNWTGLDAERFHQMALVIINGSTPYISYIDPKPPLLFFVVSVMDLVQPPGILDIPVMTVINVICAMLIFYMGNRDYGYISGFFAGLIYLVVVGFAQGYLLFSEQFAVLFLLLAFIAVRRFWYVPAGVCIGLAFGFKQYAVLGLVPLVYLMWMQGDKRYYRLIAPAVLAGILMFGSLWFLYGSAATLSAVHWTFEIAPAYLSGEPIAEIPSYQTHNLFSYTAYLIASVVIMLPMVLFSVASVLRRGLRTLLEKTLVLFVLIFSITLFIRQYLHYWILILPFLALLACREFEEDRKRSADGSDQNERYASGN